MGYRIVDTARLRPRLEDLPIESPQQLPAALRAWHAALRQWATDGWLSVESIGPLLVRLDAVQRRLRSAAARSRSSRSGSSSTRRSTRTTSSCSTLALAVAGDRAKAGAHLAARHEPPARRLARGRRAARTRRASCAGSRSSIPASACSTAAELEAAARRVSESDSRPSALALGRPLQARVARPGSRSASAATRGGSAGRRGSSPRSRSRRPCSARSARSCRSAIPARAGSRRRARGSRRSRARARRCSMIFRICSTGLSAIAIAQVAAANAKAVTTRARYRRSGRVTRRRYPLHCADGQADRDEGDRREPPRALRLPTARAASRPGSCSQAPR